MDKDTKKLFNDLEKTVKNLKKRVEKLQINKYVLGYRRGKKQRKKGVK